jgi:ABC-2 type transport system permease protein
MLWYKSWLETRWRFVIGLVLLTCSAGGTVLAYPRVMQLLPLMPAVDAGGELGRRIREAAELAREYRGYLWSQWFGQNLVQMWTVFAVLLGTGGLLSQSSGGAALFTLSLPASRNRLLGVRAATGLTELMVLALIPSLMIPLFSPVVGQTYGVASALVHALCVFVGGAAFFSLAFLLSTVFGDLWRPLLIAFSIAAVLALCGQVFPELARYSIFAVMSGETYFRSGALPWPGLLASAVLSAAMLYIAAMNIARRDF